MFLPTEKISDAAPIMLALTEERPSVVHSLVAVAQLADGAEIHVITVLHFW